MFTQYVDLILLIIVITVFLLLLLVIIVLNKVNNVEKENKSLRLQNATFRTQNIFLHNTHLKFLQAVGLNVEDISTLKQQMNLVNRWLGEVLNISNLIASKENGIETADIINELKQRIAWYEEVSQNRVSDNEFYKGD